LKRKTALAGDETMGIHFQTLALAIAHFQANGWKPAMRSQNEDGTWNAAGFTKRYTDEDGTRSKLIARFANHAGQIFASVYDVRDLEGAW
jgi:hypothetical protein